MRSLSTRKAIVGRNNYVYTSGLRYVLYTLQISNIYFFEFTERKFQALIATSSHPRIMNIYSPTEFSFFLYRASLEITKSKLSFMPRVLFHPVERRGSENGGNSKAARHKRRYLSREGASRIGLNGVTSPIVWRKTPR